MITGKLTIKKIQIGYTSPPPFLRGVESDFSDKHKFVKMSFDQFYPLWGLRGRVSIYIPLYAQLLTDPYKRNLLEDNIAAHWKI